MVRSGAVKGAVVSTAAVTATVVAEVSIVETGGMTASVEQPPTSAAATPAKNSRLRTFPGFHSSVATPHQGILKG
jgi:hypothetical protein